ncbi:hypothetical protein AB0G54_41020 [Streptomyces yokosukanensis]|uniref:hypothetical protein n=1 Tax=Streptomyces yokosukanensis TaxID=67386 RepID=UPI003415060D
MPDTAGFNARNIEEFRAHHGRLGRGSAGPPVYLADHDRCPGYQRKTHRVIPVVALILTGEGGPAPVDRTERTSS